MNFFENIAVRKIRIGCRRRRIVLALLCASTGSHVGADITLNGNNAWLELPQASLRVRGGGSAVLTNAPETVRQAIVHLPRGESHVSYGMVHTRINTEPSDIAMKSTTVAEGMVLRLDMEAGPGFTFKPGRNSVELEYQDGYGRAKYFSFLLNFQNNVPGTPPSRLPDRSVQNFPEVEPRSGKLFAVVIGISKYMGGGGRIKNLQYADKDALSFAYFLRSPAAGAIDPDNLLLLLNEKATTQNVRHALFSFLLKAQPDDTVVIYLAGHGAHDPKEPRNLYLITSDTDPDDMGGTAFPMWQIQDVFSRIVKARRVITIADTCHSYGITGEDGSVNKADSNNLFNQYLARYGATQERAVITASDISELSYEDARWGGGHGVFTYYLLRGLAGEADRNHDGNVTTGEVFFYLQTAVSNETGGKQNPRAMAGLDRSLVMSSTPKRRARLERTPAIGNDVLSAAN